MDVSKRLVVNAKIRLMSELSIIGLGRKRIKQSHARNKTFTENSAASFRCEDKNFRTDLRAREFIHPGEEKIAHAYLPGLQVFIKCCCHKACSLFTCVEDLHAIVEF